MQNTYQTAALNNNYDYADVLYSPYQTLPFVIQDALLDRQRIILVANNPSITEDKLQALLQPTDMLVLFNDFIHAQFFAHHPSAKDLPKLLFFRQNGDSLLHFGLPPRSNNLTAMLDMAQQATLGVLFGNTHYQFPTPSDDPRPNDDPITAKRVLKIPSQLDELLRSEAHCSVLSEQHSVVEDYPIFADIHSSAPTSGFLLYRLLLAACLEVQPQRDTDTPISIVMLGFNNDDKTAHFWEGHNWAFERQELAAPPQGVEIIRQY